VYLAWVVQIPAVPGQYLFKKTRKIITSDTYTLSSALVVYMYVIPGNYSLIRL
jgi:hypothetical protein